MFNHVGLPAASFDLPVLNGPNGRFYQSAHTELWYPSITTILGAAPKLFLDEWRTRLGDEAADAEMLHATTRGDQVHQLAEDYLNNKELSFDGLKVESLKMFKQMRFALNRINNICAQEVALFSDTLGVAGRVDCIGEMDGVLSVIDFKTSRNVKTEDKITDYWKQCTFYALAYHELYGVQIDDLCVIMGVENSAMPLVFKSKVEYWIEPLVESIQYYRTVNPQPIR